MQKDQLSFFRRTPARWRLLLGILFLVVGGVVLSTPTVHAQLGQSQQAIQETAQAAGFGGTTTDLTKFIGRIIYAFLSFVGVILLGYLLYGGYVYMTAQGEKTAIEKATGIIRSAIIGMMIIMASFALTAFILKALADVSGEGGLNGQGAGGLPPGLVNASGALGHGIEYHLPERNAINVPRNTPIVITFTDPINPASLVAGWSEQNPKVKALNVDNIKIFKTGQDPLKDALKSDEVHVTFTYDHRTFVIRPVKLLGSPTENIKYTVQVKGGSNGVQLEKGGGALGGSFSKGYDWSFEVSTFVDLTPPKVVAAIPVANGEYPRNIVIQITFNEAVDPTGASGLFDGQKGFSNIESKAGGTALSGEYKISNQYKTVEFLTDKKCGVNSCGKDIFCLPGDATIDVFVHAATLSKDPPQADLTDNGYDGVTDVVGNSLDGNGNDKADGKGADDYQWSFKTNNTIKLTPPIVQSTVPDSWPGEGQSNRPLDEKVRASFDSLLQASTLNSKSAKIEANGWTEKDPDTFWFFVGMTLLNANGNEIKNGETPVKAQVVISHRPYLPSGNAPDQRNDYNPFLLSDIQDAYQNCFNPGGYSNPDTLKKCDGLPNCCNNTPTDQECKFPNP